MLEDVEGGGKNIEFQILYLSCRGDLDGELNYVVNIINTRHRDLHFIQPLPLQS